MKKISVVVPCFNATAYLNVCMEHLLRQTIGIENMEIILVDDASTDDGATWNLIMEYESRYTESVIAIPLEENMRQGGARNVGISYAGGEYLFFCDADDWISLDALELLYERAKEYDADVVEFRHEIVWKMPESEEYPMSMEQEGGQSCFKEITTEQDRKEIVLRTDGYYTLGCWNKLYRLSMIRQHEICFVPHLICEEPSFTLPVRYYVKRHYFLDKVLYFYYQSPDSTVRSKWGKRRWDSSKVWLYVYEELTKRGLASMCHEELEYLFTIYYMGMSLSIWCQQGTDVIKDELMILQNTMRTLFPNAAQNRYLNDKNTWHQILLSILKVGVTDEGTQMINQLLKRHLLGSSTGENVNENAGNIQNQELTACELRNEVDKLIRQGSFEQIKELLLAYKKVTEHDNNLATVCYLCSVYEKEKAAGVPVIFSKVSDMEELLTRYTRLKFYLRRIEYDVLEEGEIDTFHQFLIQNQVSEYELSTVIDFSVCRREKVLNAIRYKM